MNERTKSPRDLECTPFFADSMNERGEQMPRASASSERSMDAVHRQQGWDDAIVDILVEFIEAAVHSLLHARRLYPPGLKNGESVHQLP